jgi:hypothetical protein
MGCTPAAYAQRRFSRCPRVILDIWLSLTYFRVLKDDILL